VHLAVVDPGVGGDRRPIALRVAEGDRVLVGPDNGLLTPAVRLFGGAVEAVDVALSLARLEPVSSTFHGRDLFAPIAARIALGELIGALGDEIDPGGLATLDLPQPEIDTDHVAAHALGIDRFGNVELNVSHEQVTRSPLRLGDPLTVEVASGPAPAVYARTFEEVGEGELLLYEDSSRMLSLAVNRGSAARLLAIEVDASVTLRPA
jgi:S-adenosylmethionine hydrolase